MCRGEGSHIFCFPVEPEKRLRVADTSYSKIYVGDFLKVVPIYKRSPLIRTLGPKLMNYNFYYSTEIFAGLLQLLLEFFRSFPSLAVNKAPHNLDFFLNRVYIE